MTVESATDTEAPAHQPRPLPGPGIALTPLLLLDYLRRGETVIDAAFNRYGDTFGFFAPGLRPGVRRVVLTRDADVVKPLMLAPAEQIDAVDANRITGQLYGRTSLFLNDGPGHRRLRKLLLPPLRGEALQQWRDLTVDTARAEARTWTTGTPIQLHPRLMDAALRVILTITISLADDELDEWLPPMRELLDIALTDTYGAHYLLRHVGGLRAWPRMNRVLAACNRLVYREIERRRTDRHSGHGDLLDVLLHAEGEPLSDKELRDQLFTILLAGHETSATATSWAIERLLRHPAALAATTQEALAGTTTAYAEAVINETLRLRPPVFVIGRITRTGYRLGDYALAPNTLILPYLRGIHENPALYHNPRQFQPERFLNTRPGTYTMLAFGGGAHRCLGDRLAIFTATTFLHTILREVELAPVDPADEHITRKAIIYTPSDGTLVRATPRTSTRPARDRDQTLPSS